LNDKNFFLEDCIFSIKDRKVMASEEKKPDQKLQITLALIGLAGVLGGAILTNLDKISSFGGGEKEESTENQSANRSGIGDGNISVDFSGNNNDENQIVVSDRIDNVGTTNIYQESAKATTAPTDIIKLLLPGTPISKATEIFGEPNRKDGNILVYNQLDNLYVRLVVDNSNTICSSTFQLRDNASVFTMYPIDLYHLGTTTFHDIFKDFEVSVFDAKESNWFPKGGNYSSVTEYFGGAGQYFTYTFGASTALEGLELEQLPHSSMKIDFLTITGDECPLAIRSGLRWYEYQ